MDARIPVDTPPPSERFERSHAAADAGHDSINCAPLLGFI
jgi:hypothetical protein